MKSLLRFAILCVCVLSGLTAIADTSSRPASAIVSKANELIIAGKNDEAIHLLSFYHPAHEELSEYHYAYAQALVGSEKSYESLEHYRLAYLYAGTEADKERLLLERAELYSRMNFNYEAAVCYEVLFKKYPKERSMERAEIGIADARYRLGEFREALAHYEKAGPALRVQYGKANALQSLGRTPEAYEIYSSLLQKDPAFINASQDTLFNAGENYRQSGKSNNAKIFFKSIKESPFREKAQMGLGLVALDEGKFADALEYFTEASRSSDRQVRRAAIINRADIFMRQGKYDDAMTSLQEVKRSFPYGAHYDRAVLMLAKLHRMRAESGEAVAVLKELIYRRTPSSAALDELESLLLEVKDKNREEFERLWKSAGRWLLDPSRYAAVIKLAEGLRYSGKPFFDVCGWLIKFGPESAKAEARLLLAGFYASIGDDASATLYLNRAKIKRLDDNVQRIKARLAYNRRDYQKTFQEIQSIRQPREQDELLLLDAMNFLMDIRKAADYCDRLFRSSPGSATAYVRFADILFNAGRKAEALQYYRSAVGGGGPIASGAQSGKPIKDLEWAYYRIAQLSKGDDALKSLKTIEPFKDTMGRFASVELRGKALSENKN